MPRSKRNERSFVDELFDMLCQVPAWVGPVLAVLAFAACRWLAPAVLGGLGDGAGSASQGTDGEKIVGGVGTVLSQFAFQAAPFVTLGILAIWIAAEIKKRSNHARLDRQTGPDSIAALSWADFESLLAEAFRREGFVVEQTGGPRPDGGVDLRLHKAGAATLVQCKHWKARSVGVSIVRELRGVVASEKAAAGVVVTSGSFTPDAVTFADKNPIRLIDGDELWRMIAAVQNQPRMQATPPNAASAPAPDRAIRAATLASSPPPTAAEPTCPLCNSPMVRRTAKRGPNAGSEFFGCSKYPDCRGTRSIEPTHPGGTGQSPKS